jgi:hypothetical protein
MFLLKTPLPSTATLWGDVSRRTAVGKTHFCLNWIYSSKGRVTTLYGFRRLKATVLKGKSLSVNHIFSH